MIYEFLTVFLLSFLIVYFLTPLMIKFARQINFVDNPNARKLHKSAQPLLGGLTVFLGFIPVALYDIVISPQHKFDLPTVGFLAGGLIILVVGLVDDRMELSPRIKMLGQVCSCLVFIYFNRLFYIFGPWFITIPIIMLWMIGLMNAFNFLDNMDGILAGMSGILAIGFFGFSFISQTPALAAQSFFIALISLTFSGSVFGFLPHNFNPSKIFLGDAGSMFIGYFLSTIGILTGNLAAVKMNSKAFFLLPVLLLSYAIFDISLVSYTRSRDGRGISQGGKDHSTHRVCTAMGSPKITAFIIYFINIIIVLVTMLVFRLGSNIVLITTTALFAGCFLFFGRKLDRIPIIITENQRRHQESKS